MIYVIQDRKEVDTMLAAIKTYLLRKTDDIQTRKAIKISLMDIAKISEKTGGLSMKYIIDFKDPFLSDYSEEHDEIFDTREDAEKRLSEYPEDDRNQLEIIEI